MKDVLIRAGKTFLQAFLGSLVVFINTTGSIDKTMLKSAIIGAIASGISAVMNLILDLLKKDNNTNGVG